jgi:predicted O-methyltransferase YrrM
MKFDEIYELLRSYRTPQGEQLLFLLQEPTMRSIYDCVVATSARHCLELGTGYGATTCIIAAALEECGGCEVTTVDLSVRQPIGVDALARYTGMSRYINVVAEPAGYNWYLADVVARQSFGTACQPHLDFCFLDGAHEWAPDALATFLVAKLLRPGAWFVLDDLDFKLRFCQPNWEKIFASRSDKELDAHQVGMVFNLVLCQHPDFVDFTVTDSGRTGWARKKASVLPTWQPNGRVLGPVRPIWQETFTALDVITGSRCTPGIKLQQQGSLIALQATAGDPFIIFPPTIDQGRPIDVVTLRVRLIEPAAETLQLFWIAGDAAGFSEEQSVRVSLQASDGMQDCTIRINGTRNPQTLRGLRIDPTDGPSVLLWESLTVAGR